MVAATLSDTRDNGNGNGGRRREPEEGIDSLIITSRKPKSRQVTSRYLSSSSSPSPSPSISTSTTTTSSSSSSSSSNLSRRSGNTLASPAIKRTQSVERRRPATPRPGINSNNSSSNVGDAGSVSVASKVLITSTRSLAVSFQGESFSLPISKTKPVPPPQSFSYVRKSTPERRRNTPLRGVCGGGGNGGGGDQLENSRPTGGGGDQHRWPGRSRVPNSLSRSLDCTGLKKNGSGNVVRALEKSMMDEVGRVSFEGKSNLIKSIQFPIDTDSIDGSVASNLVPSDAESITSCANSGSLESGGFARMRNVPPPRGISVPAKFWQETNSKLRRLQEPGTPLNGSLMVPPRIILSKRVSVDSPGPSPRTMSRGMSPLRGIARPVSPSKLMVSSAPSPSRGMPSPSRTRNSTGSVLVVGQLNNMPSILSFATRGKMGENKIEDAHLSRLLYNRLLQWRFVNARADAAMLVQRLTVEKNLYDAWKSVSELRKSVTLKRMKLQFIRHDLKLTSILRGQMIFLEECSLLDREHSSSLSGAIKALEASTLRLPVVGGARADIQNIKDAVNSAVDVMQAMASSICSSLPKVEEMSILVTQLVNMTRQERALLDQCKHLMSILAAMQVKDGSLRAQIIQVQRLPTILTTQV